MKSAYSLFFRPSFLLAIGVMLLCTLRVIDTGHALVVMALALTQNIAYTMQSRARMRTSDLYHGITAVVSTVAFFASVYFLISQGMTLYLLVPYTFATVCRNMWGKKLSERIEASIGARLSLGEKAQNAQPLSFKAVALGLTAIVIFQVIMWSVVGMEKATLSMLWIALAAFISSGVFSALSAARSTNAYWSHFAFVLFHGLVVYFTYKIMHDAHGNWSIFAPFVIGSVSGSILGARGGIKIESWLKSSWDAHVLRQGDIPRPYVQTLLALLLFVPQFIIFGTGIGGFEFTILFVSALVYNAALTLSSRSRQRNHDGYIEWSVFFSNSIWFLTLSILVMGKLETWLLLPYLIGTTIGSLWGQTLAMAIEQKIGALMGDAPQKTTV